MSDTTGGGRVLIVEDDPAAREAIHDALRADGHQVAVAADFAQAVDALTRVRFDLLLADAPGTLSGDHGTDHEAIVARVSALAGYAPVLVFTAAPALDAAGDGLAARGFNDLLRKPFDLETLRITVRRRLASAP